MSRDPWEGTGWRPNTFNYYVYSLNSPSNYSDPSGECPAPPPGLDVICVAAFIPTRLSEVEVPFLGTVYLLADNRDFSTNSRKDASRFWVWVDVNTGEIVNPEQYGGEKGYVHPTCTASGTCFAPLPSTINRIDADLQENGEIVFTYSVLCSHPICYAGPGPDGEIRFRPDGAGGYETSGIVNRFPNLEAYYWKNGELSSTLFQIQNFTDAELASGISSFDTAREMYGLINGYWEYPGERGIAREKCECSGPLYQGCIPINPTLDPNWWLEAFANR